MSEKMIEKKTNPSLYYNQKKSPNIGNFFINVKSWTLMVKETKMEMVHFIQ